jgi:hypothetical protein
MTDTQAETLSMPALLSAESQLFVADIAALCEFYVHKLGFAVAFSSGSGLPAIVSMPYRCYTGPRALNRMG